MGVTGRRGTTHCCFGVEYELQWKRGLLSPVSITCSTLPTPATGDGVAVLVCCGVEIIVRLVGLLLLLHLGCVFFL